MSRESRVTAGLLLILLPAVVYGGTSILSLVLGIGLLKRPNNEAEEIR